MYYRSDWPEVGLCAALNERPMNTAAEGSAGNPDWKSQNSISGLTVRWIASRDRFETELYGIPIWSLRLEIDGLRSEDPREADLPLRQSLREEVIRLTEKPPWGIAYVFSRVVKTEPLHRALSECGFIEVERRRIFRTEARNLKHGDCSSHADLRFTSLADFPSEEQGALRRQILDICRETFGSAGYSRHFTDPFLLGRLSGVDYILAAMKLNFERLAPDSFLLAVDYNPARVCGFSILGKKPGLGAGLYTQILSAVAREYQGRDIYSGISQLLVRMLPPQATLLNVTHAGNHAIQTAYSRSGRSHLADTSVLRRVFGTNERHP